MTRRAAVLAGTMLTMASALSAAPLPVSGITLAAEAGIGGTSKPGRWTPVRVAIDSGTENIDGDIAIEWGAASLRRPIVMPAKSRRQFELYIQTMELGGDVSARLVSNGRDLAGATVSIRALRADEPFTLCVAATGAGANADDCTATTTPDRLPRSPRGYDAADRMLWLSGDESSLSAEQRTGLRRWKALRALEDRGDLAAAERPRSIMPGLARQNRTGMSLRMGMAGYVALLLAAAYIVATRRARALTGYATLGVLIALGTAAALAAGRIGPDASVVVHHATLVHQLAGASGSVIEMRGAAAYPAFNAFELRALLADAAFEPEARPTARAQQVFDENGYPALVGTFGLGGRQAFTLYGVSDFQPLEVTRAGNATRVSNVSGQDLYECRFADAPAAQTLAVLRPGETMEAEQHDDLVGPVVTCAMASPPVTFAEARRPILTEGRAIVAAYMPPTTGHER